MTSFSSATCENLSSIGRSHSLSESVYTFTAPLVRLICAFFAGHILKIYLIKNLFYPSIRPGTIPGVCERAAKVKKICLKMIKAFINT